MCRKFNFIPVQDGFQIRFSPKMRENALSDLSFINFSLRMSAHSPRGRLFPLSTNLTVFIQILERYWICTFFDWSRSSPYYLIYLHSCMQLYFVIWLCGLYLCMDENAECCISFFFPMSCQVLFGWKWEFSTSVVRTELIPSVNQTYQNSTGCKIKEHILHLNDKFH